jgi:hypothetical protein
MTSSPTPFEQRDGRSIGELVAASQTAVWGAESAMGAVEVIAVFDHDYQAHVLVQEWDHTLPEPRWRYRLWFRDGSAITPVCYFEDAVWPGPPLVEAALLVSDWRSLWAKASHCEA